MPAELQGPCEFETTPRSRRLARCGPAAIITLGHRLRRGCRWGWKTGAGQGQPDQMLFAFGQRLADGTDQSPALA